MSPSEEHLEKTQQLEKAQRLATDRLGLKISNVEKLGQRDYNNFTYKLTLAGPAILSLQPGSVGTQHATVPLPVQTEFLVLRIPNPQASLNHPVRVQNEVAAFAVLRSAKSPILDPLIPDIYSWSDFKDEDDGGWVLYEFKEGENIGFDFLGLPFEDQKVILHELAAIVKALQTVQLPRTITGFGGLRFNEHGDIVNGQSALPIGGPFETYPDLYRSVLREQLKLADSSDLIAGWTHTNLRERLEGFIENGVESVLGRVPTGTKTIVAGDLSTSNVLIDPKSFKITALLDLEFSHIASPLEEYLYSFYDVNGILPGRHEADEDLGKLRLALLQGFPTPLPESLPPQTGPVKFGAKKHIQWHLAKAWTDELAQAGVQYPATIPYAEEVSALHWFSQEICPFYFLQEMWIEARGPEAVQKTLREKEVLLDSYLKEWGY